MEIYVSAFVAKKAVYEKKYVINQVEEQRDFELFLSSESGLVLLTDYADALETPPERIEVLIRANGEEYSRSIVCQYATIFGKITDFDGNPFPAAVIVNNRHEFRNEWGVWSDKDGNYSIQLPKTECNSMLVLDDTYGKTSLEAWCWKMIIDRDEKFDFKVGNGEVYSLDVWTSNGGFPNLMIYFRPMVLPSITSKEHTAQINSKEYKVMDIRPELRLDDIKVWLNGKELDKISLQMIYETGDLGEQGHMAMPAYVMQVKTVQGGAKGKQTLILEYDSEVTDAGGQTVRVKAQGRTQFFFSSGMALALR